MVILNVDFKNKMLISREEIPDETPIGRIDAEISKIYQLLSTAGLPAEENLRLMVRLDQLIEEGIKTDASFASMF